jgi:hypothetical protein
MYVVQPHVLAPMEMALVFVQMYHAKSAQQWSPIRFAIIAQTIPFCIFHQFLYLVHLTLIPTSANVSRLGTVLAYRKVLSEPYDGLLYAPGVILARSSYPAASRRTGPSSAWRFVKLDSHPIIALPLRPFCPLELERSPHSANILNRFLLSMGAAINLHEIMKLGAPCMALRRQISWRFSSENSP